MTAGADPGTVVAGVLDSLRQSRTLLLDPSPQNIDWCRMAISQSAQRIADLINGDRSRWNQQELTRSLLKIRSELNSISKLLDSAAAFRRNRMKGISGKTPVQAVEYDAEADEMVRHVHILG